MILIFKKMTCSQKLQFNRKKINKIQTHQQQKRSQMSKKYKMKQFIKIISNLYFKEKRSLFRIWIQKAIHPKISSRRINLLRKMKFLLIIVMNLK